MRKSCLFSFVVLASIISLSGCSGSQNQGPAPAAPAPAPQPSAASSANPDLPQCDPMASPSTCPVKTQITHDGVVTWKGHEKEEFAVCFEDSPSPCKQANPIANHGHGTKAKCELIVQKDPKERQFLYDVYNNSSSCSDKPTKKPHVLTVTSCKGCGDLDVPPDQ